MTHNKPVMLTADCLAEVRRLTDDYAAATHLLADRDAQIERLTTENRLLHDRHKFDTAEYARLTDLNSGLTDKANQYLIENARLDRELAAANAEKKALQEDLASEKKWGELWYFVSDEEPLAFETIVSQYAPKRWIDQAYKLMAARALRKGTT